MRDRPKIVTWSKRMKDAGEKAAITRKWRLAGMKAAKTRARHHATRRCATLHYLAAAPTKAFCERSCTASLFLFLSVISPFALRFPRSYLLFQMRGPSTQPRPNPAMQLTAGGPVTHISDDFHI